MFSCMNSLIQEKPYLEIIFYQIDVEIADGSRWLCDTTVFLLKARITDKTAKVPRFLPCWAVPESFF